MQSKFEPEMRDRLLLVVASEFWLRIEQGQDLSIADIAAVFGLTLSDDPYDAEWGDLVPFIRGYMAAKDAQS